MKIAILTLPLHTNYGGILQAYALQAVLKNMGHEAYVLDYNIKKRKYSFKSRLRLFITGLTYHKPLTPSAEVRRIFKEQKNTRLFINKYINLEEVDSLNCINNLGYDAIVVGSDQIWRPKYFKYHWNAPMEYAFLSFLKSNSIHKISYAASFGTEDWEYTDEETSSSRDAIASFNAVSCRENSGCQLCKEKLNYAQCKLVLDPTMLLNKAEYERIIKKEAVPQSEVDLLCYILDLNDEKRNFINRMAENQKTKLFSVNKSFFNSGRKYECNNNPTVCEWLRNFYDAKLVVTDSFHACVFSIIFNKPFVAIANSERGVARFESLLGMFNLQDCLIRNINDFKGLPNIDWNHVNYLLEKYRDDSKSFLINALKF